MSDREKTTFGRMIGVMKEEWSLHPIFEIFIDAFVKERNIFQRTINNYRVFCKVLRFIYKLPDRISQ